MKPVHRYGVRFSTDRCRSTDRRPRRQEKPTFSASPPPHSSNRMRTLSCEQDAVMKSKTKRRWSTCHSHTLAGGITQKSKTLTGKGAYD
jgi:hypothetical protein